ncbi:MAG TPA: SDR family oxidoreductase [Caulobacteraceae bacterium]|nr:SDR family oxidoreductase [Caulobacteraceae bacterium]
MSAEESGRGWALVTGGARRIGAALAIAASRAGFDIVLHVRADPATAAKTMARIEALGRRTRIVRGELADPTTPARIFVELAGEAVTLLVNNASIFEDDRIETLEAAHWDRQMAVNLRAPLLLASAFAAALPAGRGGLIVNILDQRVLRLTPQFFSYTLSKAALWAATQTLAQALAPRIRVNGIGPGPTLPSLAQGEAGLATEAAAVPLGRGPSPDDIAAALAYLIDAHAVTGELICVDGGQHLSWRTPDVLEP